MRGLKTEPYSPLGPSGGASRWGQELCSDAFDRRLDPNLTIPIAVAFSGGGDSLAALHLTKAWADRHGRRVLVLSVDHGLQPQSAAWIASAARTAARLGADFRALNWVGPKPAHGIAAAAREARHGLIADAAREAGARVVVFGHTADDILEADLMRAEGARLGALREWAPSPVWPRGRGVFLLRPLLGTRRETIRQALRAAGEDWIDDPANVDPRSMRARARLLLAGAGDPSSGPSQQKPGDDAGLAALARSVTTAPQGFLRIDREALRQAPVSSARRLLAAAVLCAGGGERPPRGDRLGRLFEQALGWAPFKATLAGSKIVAEGDLLLTRDAGEVRRGGLVGVALRPMVPTVWDGRFELTVRGPGHTARGLAGGMSGLDKAQRQALAGLPAPVRPGLPVVTGGHRPAVCPFLACTPAVGIRSLVAMRFLAACGALSKESAT